MNCSKTGKGKIGAGKCIQYCRNSLIDRIDPAKWTPSALLKSCLQPFPKLLNGFFFIMSTITLLLLNGKSDFKHLLLSLSGMSHLYNPTASVPWKVSCWLFLI